MVSFYFNLSATPHNFCSSQTGFHPPYLKSPWMVLFLVHLQLLDFYNFFWTILILFFSKSYIFISACSLPLLSVLIWVCLFSSKIFNIFKLYTQFSMCLPGPSMLGLKYTWVCGLYNLLFCHFNSLEQVFV